jgi:TolB-like protein
MRSLFTAFILGIALAGVSLAQTASGEKSGGRQAGKAEIKAAVIEFSSGANASEMPADAKRQLQTGLAAALAKSAKFDIADVRHTRDASQSDLAALNGGSSTAAAVKLGKKLGVSYVLTGTVAQYTPKDADGFGNVILKIRLVEVATGRVKHTGEMTQRSTGAMNTTGVVEMHSKTVMPAVKKLAATLLELKL